MQECQDDDQDGFGVHNAPPSARCRPGGEEQEGQYFVKLWLCCLGVV